MDRWFKALAIAMQVLTALDNALRGDPAVLAIEYRGKVFKITFEQIKL